MPKKQRRNAFYFFMVDFREEQRKNGTVYKNMAEVAEASGPAWKDAPPDVKQKYKDMANKDNGVEQYTSTQRELKEAEEREKEAIDLSVQSKVINKSIVDQTFFVMDVNYYCNIGSYYVIAEFSVTCFNLMDGITKEIHQIVCPGDIPVGYGSDAKLSSKELGFEVPKETSRRSNFKQLLANLIAFISPQADLADLPPLYTMPDKQTPVQSFIDQMCSSARQDNSEFHVYKITTLFHQLVQGIKSPYDDGFPNEFIARHQLERDLFQYSPGIACEFHHEIDKASVCCLSRTKRWIYTILDQCCPLAKIKMCAGKHMPPDYKIEVIDYKDRRSPVNVRKALESVSLADEKPLVASFVASTSLNPSPGCSTQTRPAPQVENPEPVLNVGAEREGATQTRPAPQFEKPEPVLNRGAGRGERLLAQFKLLNRRKQT